MHVRAVKPALFLLLLGACLGTLHLSRILLPALANDLVALPLSIIVLAAAISIWRNLALTPCLLGGFLFGLGYFGVAVHWLGSAANHNPATFSSGELWLQAGALCLFVPWWAIWFFAAKLMSKRLGTPDSIAIVSCFIATNLLLGDVLYGMPMAPLSLVVLDTSFAGLFRLIGQFGVDALMVALSACLAAHKYRTALAATVFGFAVLWAFDRPYGTIDPRGAGLKVYLAQHALPHPSMMDANTVETAVENEVIRAIRDGVARGASLIVLPENTFFADLTSAADLRDRITAELPDDVYTLIGFPRIEVTYPSEEHPLITPFNSAMLLGRDGPVAVIDKTHLVPFGETMPKVFFKLGFDVVAGPSGGYGHAERIARLTVPGSEAAPFAVLICYEAILSGAVARETPGARWLLNISAETAFRGTVGPRVLINQVRIRAIETGLPVLRSTAHAFSGVIGPDGTVTAFLGEEASGGILAAVPAAQGTVFRTFGYLPLYACLFVLACFGAFRRSRVAFYRLISMLDFTN